MLSLEASNLAVLYVQFQTAKNVIDRHIAAKPTDRLFAIAHKIHDSLTAIKAEMRESNVKVAPRYSLPDDSNEFIYFTVYYEGGREAPVSMYKAVLQTDVERIIREYNSLSH